MDLPPEIHVGTSGGRVLYRLPRRRPVAADAPGGLGGCLTMAGGVSLLLLGVYAGIVVPGFEKNALFGGVLLAVVTSPLALLGGLGAFLTLWLALGGRSELLLTRDRLLLRERVGPLVFRRALDPAKITLFRVHPFETGNGALEIEIHGGLRRRWAIEYPIPLLEALAADLARRKDEIFKSPPPGPADVEVLDDRVRVTVRPTSWQLWMSPLFAVGLVFWTGIAVGLLDLLAAHAREHLTAVGSVAGLFWALGAVVLIQGLRIFRRTLVFESSEGTLKALERDFLGRRARAWARADIWGYEVANGELRLRLANGKRPFLLAGRDVPTLEWIAGILRRGRPRKPVEILSTSQVRGTCQVCATEMEERIVWCRRCRTPHHRECWIYTGMCSTFGCREIGYVES